MLIHSLFPSHVRADVQRILEEDCGQNLPLCKDGTPESLERLRFAALKISAGEMDRLLEAVSLAKIDWRDLLMWAEFGSFLSAHEEWATQVLNSGSSVFNGQTEGLEVSEAKTTAIDHPDF